MTELSPAITAAIADRIADAGGDPAFLTPIMTGRVQVRDNASGTPEVVVLDANGIPQTTWRDGRPVPATINDLVKSLKANPTFAPAFGGGCGGSTSSARATSMSAADWLSKTSLATPEQRRVLFQEAAAGKFKIGN